MTIKEFAYSAQQHLQAKTGENFKRAHIYELLATSFGYSSFASLCAESVVFQGQQESNHGPQNSQDLRQRCEELGYPSATADIVFAKFPSFIAERRISFVTLSALIAKLRRQLSYRGNSDWQSDDNFDEEENLAYVTDKEWPPFYDESQQDLISRDLLAALEAAAAKENANAHYALALIHAPVDEDEREPGIDYWYNEEKRGRVLTGIEKEWADRFAQIMDSDAKYEFHLREAGRLGNEQALFDLAEKFDDPSFFERAIKGDNYHPLRVAEIAGNLGRINDMYNWLTIAAEVGDVKAIRRLIKEVGQDNLQRCWTWIYLAQLLDTDLTEGDYYAPHVDGSDYVDVREGIKLRPLNKDQDAVARQKAQVFFDEIQ